MTSFSIASKLCDHVRKKLQQVAAWLQERTKTWSKHKWLGALIVFCLASIFITVRVVVLALVETEHPTVVKQNIKSLRHYESFDHSTSPQIILIDLKHFKGYLDSLEVWDVAAFDSITKHNPSLPDSLEMLINIYEIQVNNGR